MLVSGKPDEHGGSAASGRGRGPDDGSTHWSSRRLARKLGLGHMSVARIWRRHWLQPHRLRHFVASNDPAFEAKAAEIIGLYLAPPAHAAVFCVDEKSAIQALDRLDPVLPLSPGRAERHGFEYFRHGTLSLYAALETRSGQVIGSTARRHTSQEFVRFLQEVVATQPSRKEIHLIVDNLSAHKTKLVDRFLADHPRVSPHYFVITRNRDIVVVAIATTGCIVGFVAGHLLDDHAIDEVAVLGVARALHHLANDRDLVFVIGRPERDWSFEGDRRRGLRRVSAAANTKAEP
jgi:DDE superfamily endonuclease